MNCDQLRTRSDSIMITIMCNMAVRVRIVNKDQVSSRVNNKKTDCETN